jgi:hypothetical protein
MPKKEVLKKKLLDEAHTSRYSIHHGSTKMYQAPKVRILVDTNEARDHSLCVWMWYMQKGQSWLHETGRIVATSEYSRLEMRRHYHGLHCGLTSNFPQGWLDMGDCWLLHQVFPLYTHAHSLHNWEVCRNLYCSHPLSAWGCKDNCLRLRVLVCCSLLGTTACFPWNQLDPQFGLSLTNRWPNKVSESDFGRYAFRDCVMEHQGSWDKNLSWAEFSYNNSYQESLMTAPFEVLYGHQCRTPLN